MIMYGIEHKTRGLLGWRCFEDYDNAVTFALNHPGDTVWLVADLTDAESVCSGICYGSFDSPENGYDATYLKVVRVELCVTDLPANDH